MDKNFAGKVALVTGAASGIGRTAARRFAESGARVCVADLNGEGAEQTARAIREAGFDAFACRVDIANPADNERMVDETVKRYGGLDIAYLNAAFLGAVGNFFEADTDNFDRVISINLRGCYLGLKSVGRAIRPGGAVVVTSSTAGLQGWSGNAAYSASKHGVIGLVRSAAEAFAQKGVRVNVICPGFVNTGMAPKEVREGVPDVVVAPDTLAMPPFRGLGGTQHIAEFALYLASNRAAFLTGGVYTADAGLTCSFIGG